MIVDGGDKGKVLQNMDSPSPSRVGNSRSEMRSPSSYQQDGFFPVPVEAVELQATGKLQVPGGEADVSERSQVFSTERSGSESSLYPDTENSRKPLFKQQIPIDEEGALDESRDLEREMEIVL